jgi:hypothetical protein
MDHRAQQTQGDSGSVVHLESPLALGTARTTAAADNGRRFNGAA